MTTTRQGEATGRPWRTNEVISFTHPGQRGMVLLHDAGNGRATRVDDKGVFSASDAACVVRAVNAHAGLVAALDAILGQVHDVPAYEVLELRERMRQVQHIARAALAVAKGEA